MQDAGAPGAQRGAVAAAVEPLPRGLDADQLDLGVVEERGEDADRVGAAADAGDHPRRAARPRPSSACSRASSPITRCRSRTRAGKGAGPTAEPIT